MSNKVSFTLVIFLVIISVFIFRDFIFQKNEIIENAEDQAVIVEPNLNESTDNEKNNDSLNVPMNRVSERITKKKFGDFITPQNSPVQPERFSGYHTGVDLEIFEDEENTDVLIKAICDGELISKRNASGYGGVVVQTCEIDKEAVTVTYGHLDIKSVEFEIGDEIKTGEIMGKLGEGDSVETDGERKHLHLGIHKSKEIDIRGYAQNKSELEEWIDPCLYVCK